MGYMVHANKHQTILLQILSKFINYNFLTIYYTTGGYPLDTKHVKYKSTHFIGVNWAPKYRPHHTLSIRIPKAASGVAEFRVVSRIILVVPLSPKNAVSN